MKINIKDDSNVLSEPCIRAIRLSAERFSARYVVPSHFLFEVTHNERLVGEITSNLIFTVTQSVMTNNLADEIQKVEFQFPSSPWQFFKERYFPRFLRSRFPVRYNTHNRYLTINRKAVFPFFPVDENRDMKFFVCESVSTSGDNNER